MQRQSLVPKERYRIVILQIVLETMRKDICDFCLTLKKKRIYIVYWMNSVLQNFHVPGIS